MFHCQTCYAISNTTYLAIALMFLPCYIPEYRMSLKRCKTSTASVTKLWLYFTQYTQHPIL